MCCSQFELDRITKLRAILTAYDDAILALLTGGVHEYSLDTGQGVQRVRRFDVARLQETSGLLAQQLDALEARCTNGGQVTLTPGTAPLCR